MHPPIVVVPVHVTRSLAPIIPLSTKITSVACAHVVASCLVGGLRQVLSRSETLYVNVGLAGESTNRAATALAAVVLATESDGKRVELSICS